MIIINGMPTFWITIHLADLWCLPIIYLAKIELDLKLIVLSIFGYKIADINPIDVANFFYIIYKTVLLFLFASKYFDRDLFRLISR